MFYKLTLFKQFLFVLVVGAPGWIWLATYICKCTIDNFSGWMSQVDEPYSVNGAGTYNTGENANKTKAVVSSMLPKQNLTTKWKRGSSVTGLIAGEREKPPRAHFFGRLGGKKIKEHGAYDESVLTYYEKEHWEKVKAGKLPKPVKTVAKGDKAKQIVTEYDLQQQNLAEAVRMGFMQNSKGESAENRRKFTETDVEKRQMAGNSNFPDIDDDTIDLAAEGNIDLSKAVDDAVKKNPVPKPGCILVHWIAADGKWYLDGEIIVHRDDIHRIRRIGGTGLHVGEMTLTRAHAYRMRHQVVKDEQINALHKDKDLDLTESFGRQMGGVGGYLDPDKEIV